MLSLDFWFVWVTANFTYHWHPPQSSVIHQWRSTNGEGAVAGLWPRIASTSSKNLQDFLPFPISSLLHLISLYFVLKFFILSLHCFQSLLKPIITCSFWAILWYTALFLIVPSSSSWMFSPPRQPSEPLPHYQSRRLLCPLPLQSLRKQPQPTLPWILTFCVGLFVALQLFTCSLKPLQIGSKPPRDVVWSNRFGNHFSVFTQNQFNVNQFAKHFKQYM